MEGSAGRFRKKVPQGGSVIGRPLEGSAIGRLRHWKAPPLEGSAIGRLHHWKVPLGVSAGRFRRELPYSERSAIGRLRRKALRYNDDPHGSNGVVGS